MALTVGQLKKALKGIPDNTPWMPYEDFKRLEQIKHRFSSAELSPEMQKVLNKTTQKQFSKTPRKFK